MKKYIFLIAVICLGCIEEPEEYNFEESVSVELQPFLLSFKAEAEKRGISIDWSIEKVSAVLTEIKEEAVGQCLTYQNGSNVINIDKEYWSKSSVLNKEFLLFHELGHCILQRAHLDATDSNGACTSIMTSGEDGCRRNYTYQTRNRYLAELFS